MAIIEQQSPDPLDASEALICTVGLTRILQGDMPKIGIMLQREVLDLPRRINRLAQDMVGDALPCNLKMPRDFQYQTLLDIFSNPIPEQQIENILVKFPPDQLDQAQAFAAKLATIHKQLADIIPVMQYQTCLGPINIKPTGDKLFRFWNQYWILSDPTIAFTLAQSGALLPEQVNMLVEFYPSLYEHFKTATLQALVKHKLKNAKFLNLPPRTDRGVNTMLQNKIVPFGSNQRVAVPDQGLPNPTSNQAAPKRFQTQAEKAANLS